MLVYPVLVVALGAIWPLDWTPTRLNSLSPVTGHYHGTTWTMAEKVIGGNGTDEELLVVEGNTSDEVGNNKESKKGWKQKLKEWAIEYTILDKDGNFIWSWEFIVIGPLLIIGLIVATPVAVVWLIIYFICQLFCKLKKS